MEKKLVKDGFKAAEKTLKEKQVTEVKNIVTKTLEKLDEVDKEIKRLQLEKKILKMDIDDLKEGRLDRISERQDKDPKAKNVSVVLIIKETTVIKEVNPWYQPYMVTWQAPVYYPNNIMCASDGTALVPTDGYNATLTDSLNIPASTSELTITNSIAKDATIGTYNMSGHVVHLR